MKHKTNGRSGLARRASDEEDIRAVQSLSRCCRCRMFGTARAAISLAEPQNWPVTLQQARIR